MVEKTKFRSIRPLYKHSVLSADREIDPFRVVSILKLSDAPMEKADLVVMLDATIDEVEKAVRVLAGKGIVKVEGGERPEKDVVSL